MLWLGSPQHEELCQGFAALGKVRPTALGQQQMLRNSNDSKD